MKSTWSMNIFLKFGAKSLKIVMDIWTFDNTFKWQLFSDFCIQLHENIHVFGTFHCNEVGEGVVRGVSSSKDKSKRCISRRWRGNSSKGSSKSSIMRNSRSRAMSSSSMSSNSAEQSSPDLLYSRRDRGPRLLRPGRDSGADVGDVAGLEVSVNSRVGSTEGQTGIQHSPMSTLPPSLWLNWFRMW